MRKIANIGVPTQPFSRATKLTGFTFKSYDKNSGVLRFEIKNQDGSPTDLLGATVRLFMYIYKGKEKQLFPIFDNQIITESYMHGIVKYPIPDMLLAYEGKVDAFIYIDFPDGTHTDNLAFTFNVEKSMIDGDVQLNGEYYFKDFQQLLQTITEETEHITNTVVKQLKQTAEDVESKFNELTTGMEEALEMIEDGYAPRLTMLETGKVNKNGVGEVTLDMLSQPVREAMTGGSVPVVGKDSVIGYENIVASSILEGQLADNAVGTDVTTFIKSGKNKFNPNLKIDNGYYGSSNGTWISNESFFHAGFFRCKPGQEWYVSWGVHIAFFKANMKDNAGPGVVFSNGQGGAITIPEGAFYFSVGVAKVRESVFQVELGSTPTTYEKYKLSIPELETEPMNGNKYLLDKTVPVNKLAFADMGKNMFNNQDVVSGYINPTTGTIMANASYVTSDYILVDGSEITLSGIRFYYRYTIDYGRINGGTIESNQNLTLEATSAPYLIRVTPFTNTVGSAQVEKGTEATPFEPYEVVLKHVTVEGKPIKEKVTINLPPTIYTTASKPLNIYTQNLLKHPVDDVRINYGRGLQKRNGYSETFQSNGSLNFEVYDKNGELLNSKVISIVTNNPRTTLVKALLIGDSTIRSENDMNGIVSRKMKEELGDNLTLLGTQGVAPYNHEGRSGWKFADYRTNKDGNLFFNPATNDFDFAYYLAENEIETPDAVFIQLGINDVFYSSNDTAVSSIVQTMIADLNFIASSIKSVDDNIRVVYNLPIPPNENIDTFGAAYPGTRYVQWRYRLNNHLTVQTMIDAFSNSEEIDLLAINASIDCSVNIRDGVHPTNDGYGQIATQMVAYLNNLA